MKRMFGVMPQSEVAAEKTFSCGPESWNKVTIQAGPNGWSILYADGSSTFRDIVAPTEENLASAVALLRNDFENIVEIPVPAAAEACER